MGMGGIGDCDCTVTGCDCLAVAGHLRHWLSPATNVVWRRQSGLYRVYRAN